MMYSKIVFKILLRYMLRPLYRLMILIYMFYLLPGGLATLMVWPAAQADRCTGNTACLGLWCPEASQTPKVLNGK